MIRIYLVVGTIALVSVVAHGQGVRFSTDVPCADGFEAVFTPDAVATATDHVAEATSTCMEWASLAGVCAKLRCNRDPESSIGGLTLPVRDRTRGRAGWWRRIPLGGNCCHPSIAPRRPR